MNIVGCEDGLVFVAVLFFEGKVTLMINSMIVSKRVKNEDVSVLLLVNLTLNLAGCRSFVPFENSLFHQDWVTVLNWPLLMHHPFLSSLSLYACKILIYDLSEEKFDFLQVRYVETSRIDLPDDCCSPINFPMLKGNTKSIKGHEDINWYSVVEICKNCRVYFCWKS